MANFRQYSRYPGEVGREILDISLAIPIGTHIKKNIYDAFSAYQGKRKPIRAIVVNDYTFIIDGRHRTKANFDNGETIIPASVKRSDSKELEEELFSISHYFIDEIPVVTISPHGEQHNQGGFLEHLNTRRTN
jgi:hypothetical protein